jgi:Transposase DDE domain
MPPPAPPAPSRRLKARCTPSARGRVVSRSYDEEDLDRVRTYHATEPYKKALRKRSVWVEPLFAEAKEWHGLRRFRLRRLWRVNTEALLTARGQNLKRLLSRRGGGRRPFPAGARGLRIAPSPRAASVSYAAAVPLDVAFHAPASVPARRTPPLGSFFTTLRASRACPSQEHHPVIVRAVALFVCPGPLDGYASCRIFLPLTAWGRPSAQGHL